MGSAKLAERLSKTGKDLFIELVRAYSVAEVEDYFKNGLWQDELMKSHIELIDRHRREAGAPKLPDLEDVKVPEIPVAALTAGSAKPLPKTAGVPAPSPLANSLATPCVWCARGECWTHGQVNKPEPGMEVTKPAEAEQRLIGLFIKKYQLDEAMAKEVINNRPYHQRRYIYGKFKTEATGEEGAKELQSFVEECDKNMDWPPPPAQPPKAAAAPAAPAAPSAVSALAAALASKPAAGGVKRPAAMMSGAPATMDANKSARMAQALALAQRLSGVRAPNAAAAIRAAAAPNPAVNPAAAILAARKAASANQAAAWRPAAASPRAASQNPAAALAALLSSAAAARPQSWAGKGAGPGIRPRAGGARPTLW